MRLIDADRLKETLEELKNKSEKNQTTTFGLKVCARDRSIQAICDMMPQIIDSEPTVYPVRVEDVKNERN